MMVLPVEVVNGTIHFIQQSDQTTVNLVYATWAIAITTIGGIILSTIFTRRALNESRRTNHLMALELKTKFRPNFEISVLTLKYNLPYNKTANLSFQFTNKGSTSASNISFYYNMYSNEIELSSILKDWSTIEHNVKKIPSTLEFGQYHWEYIGFKVDPTKDSWIVIWFKYEYLGDIREEYIVRIQFGTFSEAVNQMLPSKGFASFNNDIIQAERKRLEL